MVERHKVLVKRTVRSIYIGVGGRLNFSGTEVSARVFSVVNFDKSFRLGTNPSRLLRGGQSQDQL